MTRWQEFTEEQRVKYRKVNLKRNVLNNRMTSLTSMAEELDHLSKTESYLKEKIGKLQDRMKLTKQKLGIVWCIEPENL